MEAHSLFTRSLACRLTGSSVTAAAISGSTKSASASRPRWLRKRTTFAWAVHWWMDIWANEGSRFPPRCRPVCWSRCSGCVTDPVLPSILPFCNNGAISSLTCCPILQCFSYFFVFLHIYYIFVPSMKCLWLSNWEKKKTGCEACCMGFRYIGAKES